MWQMFVFRTYRLWAWMWLLTVGVWKKTAKSTVSSAEEVSADLSLTTRVQYSALYCGSVAALYYDVVCQMHVQKLNRNLEFSYY